MSSNVQFTFLLLFHDYYSYGDTTYKQKTILPSDYINIDRKIISLFEVEYSE